jgi:hypothetical protein
MGPRDVLHLVVSAGMGMPCRVVRLFCLLSILQFYQIEPARCGRGSFYFP